LISRPRLALTCQVSKTPPWEIKPRRLIRADAHVTLLKTKKRFEDLRLRCITHFAVEFAAPSLTEIRATLVLEVVQVTAVPVALVAVRVEEAVAVLALLAAADLGRE
jgi:hypothetical protein